MFDRVLHSMTEIAMLAVLFAALAILRGGHGALRVSDRQKRNWRLNLCYYASDLLLVIPVLVLVNTAVRGVMPQHTEYSMAFLIGRPDWVIAVTAVVISDLVGYWRHRMMHLRFFWPVHAAHHSDEDLSWFSLLRFHPLNRLISTAIDAAVLAALGLPLWAVAFSNLFRHFYGYFVHSGLPWRFGPLRYILVSPFLHRWHHASDLDVRDKNFATVFAFYDLVFGTYFCPQTKANVVGVADRSYPVTFAGQLLYPFRQWLAAFRTNAKEAETHHHHFVIGK